MGEMITIQASSQAIDPHYLPTPILSVREHSYGSERNEDAVLCKGEVTLLCGQHGIGKSVLATQIVAEIAMWHSQGRSHFKRKYNSKGFGPDVHTPLVDDVFHCSYSNEGNDILMLSNEDIPSVIKRRLLFATDQDANPLQHVSIANIRGRPLFGVLAGGPGVGKLDTWADMEEAINHTSASLVVIDSALTAFAGDIGYYEHVRAFIDNLRSLAEQRNCAILMVASSYLSWMATDKDLSHWENRSQHVIGMQYVNGMEGPKRDEAILRIRRPQSGLCRQETEIMKVDLDRICVENKPVAFRKQQDKKE